MLTNKTDNTVNADNIIPLYPDGSICLFSINKKEIERSAAIESEDIKLALAIIFPTADMLELAPICAPRPEKIRMLTNKTDNTVNADNIIPLYPDGSICLFSINKKEIERSAAIESEDIKLALAIIFPILDISGKIAREFTNSSTAIKIMTPTITGIKIYSRINCLTAVDCFIVSSDSIPGVSDDPSSFLRVVGEADEEENLSSISRSSCRP